MSGESPLLDLTPIQRAFVQHYALHGSATDAYQAASPKTAKPSARSAGSRLMRLEKVKAAIAWLKANSRAPEPKRSKPVLVDLKEYAEAKKEQIDAEASELLTLIEAKKILTQMIKGEMEDVNRGVKIPLAASVRLAAFDRYAQIEGWTDKEAQTPDDILDKATAIRHVRQALQESA